MGRPVLKLAEAGLMALELGPGAAVLEVVPEPGEQPSANPLSCEGGEDDVGAARSRMTTTVVQWLVCVRSVIMLSAVLTC